MFRGVSGHTGGQGEDNNDADSSDDESIMSRENENNTSNIPPNSGSDNHNRRTTSGGKNSRELDSSFGNRRVTGELQQHAYMMTVTSVLHPERRYWQHGS